MSKRVREWLLKIAKAVEGWPTTQIYAQVGDATLVGAILTRSHGS